MRDFGSAKELARFLGCSETTARKYRRGETVPNAIDMVRLMGASQVVARAILRLCGFDTASNYIREARLRDELARLRTSSAAEDDADARADAALAALSRRLLGDGG